MITRDEKFILWFEEVDIKDIPLVGGKNASLGEMIQKLTSKGVRVPGGFAVTSSAYRFLLEESGAKNKIREILKTLNTRDTRNLAHHALLVRKTILQTRFPKKLTQDIGVAYKEMQKRYGKNVDMAVRSSATAEDLPDASFAGQQETYLNIRGEKELQIAIKKAFASLFTDRAVSYRQEKGFDHFSIALSVAVQKMVRSDKAASGVMFSIDTETGFQNAVLINAAYGLGENVVQGAVNPDEYYVFKPTLDGKHQPIISKELGSKRRRMIYNNDPKNPTKNVFVSAKDRERFVLTNKEILQLAQWAVVIENHYHKPMDMEWAKDGLDGKLYIVQARPETVQSQKDRSVLEEYKIQNKGAHVLITGTPVGSKVGSGKARVIRDVSQIHEFQKGEVLVTDMTDPDWEPIMKIAGGIVTNRGGRTSHAAIVSREFGVPAVIGTETGTKKIPHGAEVTVSCAEGDDGKVYKGIIPFEVHKTSLKGLKKPRHTKIMMNIGSPELAFSASFIPNDGVGLAREEFIVTANIKIHPLALVHFDTLKSRKTQHEIEKLTKGYKDKKQYFIDKLAYGIATIGAAFYPKDVIFRLSDFKTNEYAGLIGGQEFEPHEENPMIGWRGASRYYDATYAPAFAMECAAYKKVRDDVGLKNVKIMIPICRTPEEGKRVIAELAKNGLVQHKDGLEIYVMCEVPSNVILAEEFAKIFDGFSIGSNDLTQMTLAVDRDSQLVSHIYNENNEAVKWMIAHVIDVAHKTKTKIGICGQGPSDSPEFARFLLDHKIDSMSLNPDTVVKTTMDLAKHQK